ncbi:MAG: class I SAM-dependent methyltransferase [Chloroflexota bacterium]|nr:class I SAM-dependent methyltransferase [Dehalococcoidia bacterium]MDW8255189.1 class I SAM-dependent methyltransferase [Chloroflexota bacterium]
MNRGKLGTMPRATERDDESYLAFVEGARVFASALDPQLREAAGAAITRYQRQTGRLPQTVDDAKRALDPVPIIASRNRIMRTTQEMMWRGVIDTYAKRKDELLAELEAAERSPIGSVEWDPNFQYPDYFAKVEFHIQPGSYYADPLAGYIYHYGTKIFFLGQNDRDDIQTRFVNRVPAPADGVVNRVLDVACSIGQSTTALKQRFVQAEVWGIDAAAPMVRYAHKRAVEMGLPVHFRQALAERLPFPDEYFDIVFSYILFHELPREVMPQVLAEMRRVTRPGGIVAIVDFQTLGPALPPLVAYFFDFSRRYNGEPYAADFITLDFLAMMREAGLRNVREIATGEGFAGLPLRVGEK